MRNLPVPDGRRTRGADFNRAPDDRLTPRELQVLSLASRGMTTAGTATRLGVAYEAAADYRRQARKKLRAKNTCHAVAVALRAGLIV